MANEDHKAEDVSEDVTKEIDDAVENIEDGVSIPQVDDGAEVEDDSKGKAEGVIDDPDAWLQEQIESDTEDNIESELVSETGDETEVDPIDSLPEDKPKPDDWKVLRNIYKEQKKKVKELQTQLDSQQSSDNDVDFEFPSEISDPAFDTTPKPEVKSESEGKPEITPEFLFKALVDIENGELDSSYKGEVVRRLSNLKPIEIVDVMTKAQNDAFGDKSEDIVDFARQQLPIANASYDQIRDREKQQIQAQKDRAGSWRTVLETLPELKNKQSDEYRVFAEVASEMRNNNPGLWNNPNAPSLILERVDTLIKAAAYDQILPEYNNFKKNNAMSSAPLSSNRHSSTMESEISAEDLLEQGLIAAGLRV